MKRLVVSSLAVIVAAAAVAAQQAPQSPAATESKTFGGKTVSVTYSAPKVNGRAGKLFGKDGRIGQDRNYPVWRAGANAATKFHTDADLQIGSLAVPKGDYTLYVDLSDPAAWKLIVNKQTGQWGLSYDQAQDLGRVPMTMSKPPALVEELKYTIADGGGSKGTLTLAWENVVASVPSLRAQAAARNFHPTNFAGWDELDAAVREKLATMPANTRLLAGNFKIGAGLGFARGDAGIAVLAHPLNDTVQVIDTQTKKVVHEFKPGPAVLHMEFTPRGNEVWISVRDAGKVMIYDTHTFEKLGEIAADSPSGIFFTARAHRTGL